MAGQDQESGEYLHLRYQANSIKSRRLLSYLTLAKYILQQTTIILMRLDVDSVLKKLARSCANMVVVY